MRHRRSKQFTPADLDLKNKEYSMPRTMVHAMWLLVLSTLFANPTLLIADGPKDNLTDNVRPIPPTGIELTAADRVELEIGLVVLRKQLNQLRTRQDKRTAALLPDVEIFYRAVHDALKYREFFAPRDVNEAKQLLAGGRVRATQLAAGKAPWTTQTGLEPRRVAGGRSEIRSRPSCARAYLSKSLELESVCSAQ
jgi:hypothetical protein